MIGGAEVEQGGTEVDPNRILVQSTNYRFFMSGYPSVNSLSTSVKRIDRGCQVCRSKVYTKIKTHFLYNHKNIGRNCHKLEIKLKQTCFCN